MPTTITLDADVAEFFKEQSRLLNKPLEQVANETLRRDIPPRLQKKKKPPKFRVKPFKGGFAPGVDPTQLNRLNDQLEVEEYVRKANFDNP